jgi:hypothetical protein
MRLVQLPSGTSLDSGVDTLTLTFNPANVNSPREFADSLYVCGGVLGAFDGVTFAEEGFHLYPEPPALSQVAGGSLSSPGNYSVLALYRYTDDFGRRRVSQASAPTEISLSGANRTIRAVIKTLKLHGRPGKAAIEVYCTTNNAPDDHRLVAAVANVETVDTVTVDITASDAQIALGQESPSDGDVLEPEPPPPALAVWPVKDRLAVIDATDPTRVLVSLPLSETEGPRFNSVSSFRVDDGRGDLIGGAAADDRSILFKRDAIYAVLGDGPDLQGNGTFGLAQLIAAGIGTVEPRSIVSTPDGVMFRSISNRSGIFMVNRGLAIDDQIGKPVQENLRGLSVVEAVHIPETLQTKFVTSAGQILVYDHVTKLWDVDVGACESATAYGGRMVRQQQGQVAMFMIAEDITGTVFDDSSGPVALYAETPWISIAKLKGYFRFKRVQLTGEKRIISDEDDPGYRVTLTLFKDFDDTPLATVARNMLVTDDINAVELRYSAKVSALKIGVTISQKEGGSVNFAGPKLTGLTVVYAVKEGLRKTASGNRLT